MTETEFKQQQWRAWDGFLRRCYFVVAGKGARRRAGRAPGQRWPSGRAGPDGADFVSHLQHPRPFCLPAVALSGTVARNGQHLGRALLHVGVHGEPGERREGHAPPLPGDGSLPTPHVGALRV